MSATSAFECDGQGPACYFREDGSRCWPTADELLLRPSAARAADIAALGVERSAVNFGAMKRSAGRGGAKNCQSWFRSNAEDAASADGERQRRATARLREATESSCMATQKMAGRKQNPWGTKHEQVVGLHTVPFAFDSRLEPGDFAEVFGLPRGAPASED